MLTIFSSWGKKKSSGAECIIYTFVKMCFFPQFIWQEAFIHLGQRGSILLKMLVLLTQED